MLYHLITGRCETPEGGVHRAMTVCVMIGKVFCQIARPGGMQNEFRLYPIDGMKTGLVLIGLMTGGYLTVPLKYGRTPGQARAETHKQNVVARGKKPAAMGLVQRNGNGCR